MDSGDMKGVTNDAGRRCTVARFWTLLAAAAKGCSAEGQQGGAAKGGGAKEGRRPYFGLCCLRQERGGQPPDFGWCRRERGRTCHAMRDFDVEWQHRKQCRLVLPQLVRTRVGWLS